MKEIDQMVKVQVSGNEAWKAYLKSCDDVKTWMHNYETLYKRHESEDDNDD